MRKDLACFIQTGVMLCPLVPSTSPSKPQEASHILRYPITNSTLHPKQRGRVTTPIGKTWWLVGQTTAVKLNKDISTRRKSIGEPPIWKVDPRVISYYARCVARLLEPNLGYPDCHAPPQLLTPIENDQKPRRCSKSKRDYKSQKGHFRQVACCGRNVFLFVISN